MREVVINTRADNDRLRRENEQLRKQNGRFRRVFRHTCTECHDCAERAKLVRDALGEAIP